MTAPFYDRLRQCYSEVGRILRGEAVAAGVFANTSDIGLTREGVYAEFLRHHLPSGCNVLLGGFLFGIDGSESRQLDVIITTDTCPRFNFFSREWGGKSFACIDGAIGVVSAKSYLDTTKFHEALDNIASIPRTSPLEPGMVNPLVNIEDYDDLPYKIIYAPDGATLDTIRTALFEYYAAHRTRVVRSPNLIHVACKYWIIRVGSSPEQLSDGMPVPAWGFVEQDDPTDVAALAHTVIELQMRLAVSRHVVHDYARILAHFPIQKQAVSHRLSAGTLYTTSPATAAGVPNQTFDKDQHVLLLETDGLRCRVRLADGSEVYVLAADLKPLSRHRSAQ